MKKKKLHTLLYFFQGIEEVAWYKRGKIGGHQINKFGNVMLHSYYSITTREHFSSTDKNEKCKWS